MAVLVEANSVIVRVQAIHERFAGGWAGFAGRVPNNTLCSDNEVARVGFMDPKDCRALVDDVERSGLTFLSEGHSKDIAVADQTTGLTVPCDWLEVGHIEMRPGQKVAAVQLKGTRSSQLFCPEGWTYERSLSREFALVPPQHLNKSLKFLRHQDGLDVYFNMLSGKKVFIGRPKTVIKDR